MGKSIMYLYLFTIFLLIKAKKIFFNCQLRHGCQTRPEKNLQKKPQSIISDMTYTQGPVHLYTNSENSQKSARLLQVYKFCLKCLQNQVNVLFQGYFKLWVQANFGLLWSIFVQILGTFLFHIHVQMVQKDQKRTKI